MGNSTADCHNADRREGKCLKCGQLFWVNQPHVCDPVLEFKHFILTNRGREATREEIAEFEWCQQNLDHGVHGSDVYYSRDLTLNWLRCMLPAFGPVMHIKEICFSCGRLMEKDRIVQDFHQCHGCAHGRPYFLVKLGKRKRGPAKSPVLHRLCWN